MRLSKELPQINPRLSNLFEAAGNTKDSADGKLGPNGEGPCKITTLVGRGAYHLEDPEGKKVPRPWSSNNLRKYYQ